MRYKKSLGSNICWLSYTLIIGIALLCMVAGICENAGFSVYVSIPIFLVVLLAISGVAFGLHGCVNSYLYRLQDSPVAAGLLKAVGITVFLTVGLYLRLQYVVAFGDTEMFKDSAVELFDLQSSTPVHGSTYLFLNLYLLVFSFINAYAGTTIVMELVFQLLIAFLLYFCLHKRVGYLCGLTSFAFMMVAPSVIQRLGHTSSESLMVLLSLFVCMLLLIDSSAKENSVYLFLCGILVGLLVYLNITAVLLVVVLLSTAVQAEKNRLLNSVAGLAGGFLAFIGYVCLDAMENQMVFSKMLTEWWSQSRNYYDFSLQLSVENIVLFLLMSLVGFGYYFFAKKDQLSLAFLMCLAIFALKWFGLPCVDVTGNLSLFLLLVYFAGLGLNQCCEMEAYEEEVDSHVEDDEIYEEERLSMKEKVQPFEPAEWVQNPVQEPPVPKVQFLENPLPLPKKHVKKAIDFPITLTRETAEYDYEISENDDFDI